MRGRGVEGTYRVVRVGRQVEMMTYTRCMRQWLEYKVVFEGRIQRMCMCVLTYYTGEGARLAGRLSIVNGTCVRHKKMVR